MRWLLTTTSLRPSSTETEPQFIPPTMPGYWIVPSVEGGVKMPSERADSICLRQARRSQGRNPKASSAVSVAGCSGRGRVGNGCVGEIGPSSGTKPACGTGRSSTGKSGRPVTRSRK